MHRTIRLTLFTLLIALTVTVAEAHAQSAAALLRRSADAMGGLAALGALKNQVVESEGKQFDSSSTQQPLGPTRQINTFRYTLTRDLTQPRLRLQWAAQSLGGNPPIERVEPVAGTYGKMKRRVYAGEYARLREWSQVVAGISVNST